MTVVTCIKVGTLYGPEYVNRLARAVAKYTTVPHRFLCLTDDPAGVECDRMPIETTLPGWWAKLVLFKPVPWLIGRRILFFDLDTVIVGNIDTLCAYQGAFCILRDFYRSQGYGSGVMAIAPGFGKHIWDNFTPDVMQRLHGDQNWLEEQIPQADRWQDIAPGVIGSYKADQLQDGPKGFSVCCFHGVPKPHEVDGWVREHWRD